MIYLSAEKLTKSFPEQLLFRDITFGIYKGDKIALIANNGTGKSSLIKILAGLDAPDSGSLYVPDRIRCSVLEQEPDFPPHLTIREVIQETHRDIRSLIEAYHQTLENLDVHTESGMAKLAELTAVMDQKNAWDYERDLMSFLTRFKVNEWDAPVSTMSGGQKKRVALAITLASHPDLLILDEPTNHLDVDMIEWLEGYLTSAHITLLMVTHDRYFLERVCTQILELHQGKLYRHPGNYQTFLENKTEREEIKDREIEKAGSLLKRELEWMRRTPEARSTKAKARIDAFYELEDKVNSRSVTDSLQLDLKTSRVGGKILELKNIRKEYHGRKLVNQFTYTFKKGDRVGIVGPNGAGKSTLLNIMTGSLLPDAGQVNIGETLVLGYYNQQGIVFKEEERIIDFAKNIAEVIVLSNGVKISVSAFLTHFMFSPEMQYKPIDKLSGGEKRRLHLMSVLLKNPNFLILDEPTNDLDLLTLNKLEEFLESYPGCLVIVSHDRYFLDKLVDHLFILEEGGTVKDYNGTYSEYRTDKQIEEQVLKKKEASPKAMEINRKVSSREKNEMSRLEKEIETLEERKKKLEDIISSAELNPDNMVKISMEIGVLLEDIDVKTQRWMDLAENSSAG